jgi:stage IV sporulation protein FB
MFLAEPPQTPWDLNFQLFGFRVRISPFFWLGTALLGWGFAEGVAKNPETNLNVGLGLIMWITVVLVSITVHELGHAFAFRYYGTDADIVLYQFGGLAIPRGSFGFGRQVRMGSKEQIVISAAGPAASLMLGIGVGAIFYVGGFQIPNPLWFIRHLDFLHDGKPISATLWYLLHAILYVNIWWAFMNLLPVYPLDGGQISRELFVMSNYQSGIKNSLILSIVAAAGVALWAFSRHDTYLGIMFALLGYSSFQILQAYSGRGGFGGGW